VEFSINNSSLVTSVSDSLKNDTLENFNIRVPIEVIPNFIDIHQYNMKFDDCDRSTMALNDERIITHISNMRSVKRIPDVINIFKGISDKIPAVLIMVGDGPERKGAEQLSRKLGISHKIKFLGNSTEIDRILCFSDLFLLPSEKESFGLAALEAMANRTPVISTNTGGLPEVNECGFSGFTADVGDIDTMVEHGLKILESEEELNKFKNNAFAKAKEFDAKNIIPIYEKAYQKVTGKSSAE
jgi:N-acetyl-alpha-D-glucosaminyl L-malate synthase BshA